MRVESGEPTTPAVLHLTQLHNYGKVGGTWTANHTWLWLTHLHNYVNVLGA